MKTMTKPKAFISSIGRHRFEIDGDGIRSLVVFAGCPLRCKYCVNPYTWDGSKKAVPFTPEMLLAKVSVDSVYFQATNGGITFGGGEPLLHANFIKEFIQIAPKCWNYIVETSLAVPFENIQTIADKIDTFVVDIKSMDSTVYHFYTGGDLTLAHTNLTRLIDMVGTERVTVRIPLIPGYADETSQATSVKQLLTMGVTNIDSFKYIVK